MQRDSSPRFACNGVVVDFGSETLRDASGQRIPLRPQAFAVLRYLVEHPRRLVTKDELLEAVWPGLAVTDDSLVQCIVEIRRALGDRGHALLRTVPRRGYLLALPDPAASARPWRRWALGLGVALAATMAAAAWWLPRETGPTMLPLVAVLPFEAMSGDDAAARLADGLTGELITDLARFPEFGVLARNTTRAYADADPRRVGAELDARFVVTGSMDRQGESLRVTAELVDAETGGSLWSGRWHRPIGDFFAMQGEVAEEIANRVGGGGGLVQEAGRIAARRKPPESLTAYELYLLGTEQLEELTQPGIEAARELLTRAVELDPHLARAWIELYYVHKQLANLGIDPERNRALAVAAAERAVALDPSDPEAHVVHGSSFGIRDDFVRAKAAYETALRMAPNSAEILILYIGWASSFGDAQRGADLVERAIRLDPHYKPWANRMFGVAYFMAGRYDQAIAFFEKAGTERYARWTWGAHAGALAATGRSEEAAALVEGALSAHPGLSIQSIIGEPGWTEAERARFVEVMRLAGFPPCDPPATPSGPAPVPLPECAPIAGRN